jgi:hypothetical protein
MREYSSTCAEFTLECTYHSIQLMHSMTRVLRMEQIVDSREAHICQPKFS